MMIIVLCDPEGHIDWGVCRTQARVHGFVPKGMPLQSTNATHKVEAREPVLLQQVPRLPGASEVEPAVLISEFDAT